MPIIVNDVEISDAEIYAEMQYHPAASLQAAKHKAAQALVIRQLLLQAAAEKELLPSAPETSPEQAEQALGVLIEQEISLPLADEDSCRRYYEKNLPRFVDKSTDKLLPFESVLAYIREYLFARSLRTGINHYIQHLLERAQVVGFALERDDSPHAQYQPKDA